MVVIIDDRADVWEWSPNLLKVRPCMSHSIYVIIISCCINIICADDFFVGIGDINSTLLSKAPTLLLSPPSTPRAPSPEDDAEPSAKEAAATLASQNQITSERIAAQVEERPLAKKQELLEEEEEKEDTKTAVNGTKKEDGDVKHEKHQHRKALLKNDDTELVRVAAVRFPCGR